MKKHLMKYAALAALAAAVSFTACDEDNTLPNDEKEQQTTTPIDTLVVVAVTGVSLNLSVDTLTVGDTLRLIATVVPDSAANQSVTWASSNDTLATVANGLVTALKAGAANIVVTTTDGSKKDTCAITVSAVPLRWTSAKFGTVSFASIQTWKVGNQEWTDVVQASGCKKNDFNGGSSPDFLADCRSNLNGYKGDLFSWKAVTDYKTELCPDGWRVPTKDEFVALDVALGGTGADRVDATTCDKYLSSLWGGSFGGYCLSDGGVGRQGSDASYWSQSEGSAAYGFSLGLLSDGVVFPQGGSSKSYGHTLRCVR